jgi:hypothetical protein
MQYNHLTFGGTPFSNSKQYGDNVTVMHTCRYLWSKDFKKITTWHENKRKGGNSGRCYKGVRRTQSWWRRHVGHWKWWSCKSLPNTDGLLVIDLHSNNIFVKTLFTCVSSHYVWKLHSPPVALIFVMFISIGRSLFETKVGIFIPLSKKSENKRLLRP